jgi:GTP-binding protein LepA
LIRSLKRLLKGYLPPKGDINAPLQALIFDSVYNPFRGVIAYFRVFNGKITKGDHVKFMATKKEYDADEVGVLKMQQIPKKTIYAGDVGYIISGIKEAREVKVGDTITHIQKGTTEMIQGFENVKPMVFAGIYPVENDDFEELRQCHGESFSSMMHLSLSSLNHQLHWDLDFAADSWECFIWRLCKSAWNVNLK